MELSKKSALIALAISCLPAFAANDSWEYKLATIDVGKFIPESDTSVARIRGLLIETQRVYKIDPTKAGDQAVLLKTEVAKKGTSISVADVLDFALIACDTKCTPDEYTDNIVQYAQIRMATHRPTHQQATHAFLIISYVAKNELAKQKKK